MTEPLPDVNQLPSKELPKTLKASSYDDDLWLRVSDVQPFLRERVELQQQLRTAQEEIARLETHIIERQPLKVTSTSDCPVVFEKGQLGTCTACGKNFECGAVQPAVIGCIHDSAPTELCQVCYPSQPPGGGA